MEIGHKTWHIIDTLKGLESKREMEKGGFISLFLFI